MGGMDLTTSSFTKKNDPSLQKSKLKKKIAQQIMLLKSTALISFFSFHLTFYFSSFFLFVLQRWEVEIHHFFHFSLTCLDSINFLNLWFSYKESEDTVL